MQSFEDKAKVDDEIAKYFTQIYKRPDYRRQQPSEIDFNVDGEEEMQIDTNNYGAHHSGNGNVTSFYKGRGDRGNEKQQLQQRIGP
jgi:hypothetical protein